MSLIVPDLKREDGTWLATMATPEGRKSSRAFIIFNGMRARCTPGSAAQTNRPTYAGCVCEFSSFQEFADWAVKQIGYDQEGWCFDKDLLIKGNRIYSKETCVFVPKEINNALTNRSRYRGEFPVGVSRDKRRIANPYIASIEVDGKTKRIGSFDTVEKAFAAYKAKKEDLLRDLARKYKDQIDPRAYAALMAREIEITD